MEQRRFSPFLIVTVGMMSVAWCSISSAVQLQLKLAKGKIYYEKTTVDQHTVRTLMNQQQAGDLTIGLGMKLDVLDVDGAGNMQVRYTYIWCMCKQADVMGNLSYDSAQQTTPPAGAEPLAALMNQSYVLQLSPKGRVLDVSGVEQMKEAVQKKLPPGAEATPMGFVAATLLDKTGVKEATEGLMAVYPDKPVDSGQSWNEKRVLKAGFGRIEEIKWTLQKEAAGVATIGQAATIRSDPAAAPMEVQGMRIRMDLSGNEEATIQIAEATGLLQMEQGRQQLKGEMKIGDAAPDQPMMPIPTVLDTKTRVEMSEKMWQTATK